MKILFAQKMNGVSGSELYLLQILPELKARGYDVEMLCFYPVHGHRNKTFVSHLADYGVKTHEIYGHKSVSPLLVRKVATLIKDNKYDLVQANLVHADFLMAMVKTFLHRKMKLVSVKHGFSPAYMAVHGYDFRFLKKDAFYWIERIAGRAIDFNVTISKGLYNVFLEGNIVKPTRLRNIYYGLTLSPPVHENTSAQIPDYPYVLITGRLVGFKGHEYLIRSWKKVKETRPDLRLVIAGDGPLRNKLEQLSKENDLEDVVVFMGHVPNPHSLMENCQFTVVTSIWEGFGLILLESWLHRKPIVAFNVPAMNEVIEDGVSGLLVPLKDEDRLAEKILQLAQDKHAIHEYGEAGYKRLTGFFNLKRMTDEMEGVYKAMHENKAVPLT
ncbi:glycosyltransferase [Terrimonas sp. NA20]|uniref:Glycosyltransferase n=1 Tax=Terrimonas ginsenosidimutans TaxID=2908004 RepID=A0ABS9KNS6_9BACT|nr:glycosyltransferase [Terrimonas ginsenosidimutans]MCG2613983.1 glycosyltransferase [Terrimonas ginsenosidimutans]